jgi:hypothetical protein
MLRVNSLIPFNSHNSANLKPTLHEPYSTKNPPIEKQRKTSLSSLKENMPDLEKLIMEIKISPLSANSDNIKQIYSLLKKL